MPTSTSTASNPSFSQDRSSSSKTTQSSASEKRSQAQQPLLEPLNAPDLLQAHRGNTDRAFQAAVSAHNGLLGAEAERIRVVTEVRRAPTFTQARRLLAPSSRATSGTSTSLTLSHALSLFASQPFRTQNFGRGAPASRKSATLSSRIAPSSSVKSQPCRPSARPTGLSRLKTPKKIRQHQIYPAAPPGQPGPLALDPGKSFCGRTTAVVRDLQLAPSRAGATPTVTHLRSNKMQQQQQQQPAIEGKRLRRSVPAQSLHTPRQRQHDHPTKAMH